MEKPAAAKGKRKRDKEDRPRLKKGNLWTAHTKEWLGSTRKKHHGPLDRSGLNKGPDGKYFNLYAPYNLWCKYSHIFSVEAIIDSK